MPMTSPLEQCRDALREIHCYMLPLIFGTNGGEPEDGSIGGNIRAALAAADAALAAQTDEPIFYVRLLPSGLYEGPHHAKSWSGKELRDAKPGEWTPLYAAPKAAQCEPAPAMPDDDAIRGLRTAADMAGLSQEFAELLHIASVASKGPA